MSPDTMDWNDLLGWEMRRIYFPAPLHLLLLTLQRLPSGSEPHCTPRSHRRVTEDQRARVWQGGDRWGLLQLWKVREGPQMKKKHLWVELWFPPNLYAEVLPLRSQSVSVFGASLVVMQLRCSHLGGLSNKTVVLVRGDQGMAGHRRRATWRSREKTALWKPKKEGPEEANPASHLEFGLQKLWEYKLLLCKTLSLRHFIMAALEG